MSISKRTFLSFLTILLITEISQTSAQQKSDWSEFFPEIPNCERNVHPLTKNGLFYEQTAVYVIRNRPKTKNAEQEIQSKTTNSDQTLVESTEAAVETPDFRCGSITLQIQPSAKKVKAESYKQFPMMPFYQISKIKNYEVYQSTPMCGNDASLGSTEVYFDSDKILRLYALKPNEAILNFAENADYEKMKRLMNDFVQSDGNISH